MRATSTNNAQPLTMLPSIQCCPPLTMLPSVMQAAATDNSCSYCISRLHIHPTITCELLHCGTSFAQFCTVCLDSSIVRCTLRSSCVYAWLQASLAAATPPSWCQPGLRLGRFRAGKCEHSASHPFSGCGSLLGPPVATHSHGNNIMTFHSAYPGGSLTCSFSLSGWQPSLPGSYLGARGCALTPPSAKVHLASIAALMIKAVRGCEGILTCLLGRVLVRVHAFQLVRYCYCCVVCLLA